MSELHEISRVLGQIEGKLDTVVEVQAANTEKVDKLTGLVERVEKTEDGVRDYYKNKHRAMGVVAVIGVGISVTIEGAKAWLGKLVS
jgi:hypothetical protein